MLGLGGVIVQSGLGGEDTPSNDAGAVRDSSADKGLEREVRALLAQEEGFTGQEAPDSGDSQQPSTDKPLAKDQATTVPNCVREGIGRSDAPLAVDAEARHQGTSAFLVLLPHIGDAGQVDAYVVDASCVTEGSTPGKVLVERTFTRN
jgi:hypothetical protein